MSLSTEWGDITIVPDKEIILQSNCNYFLVDQCKYVFWVLKRNVSWSFEKLYLPPLGWRHIVFPGRPSVCLSQIVSAL